MILDTTTRKLQIVLTSNKTTTDMPVVVDWVDNTTTTFTPGVTPTTTNGVSLVDILAAPAGSTQRKVNGLTIVNLDTAIKTVQVFLNDNGTSYQIQSQLLQVGDKLCYTDAHGWYTTSMSLAGPCFSAYLPTSNQSVSSGVATKVALSSKEFDITSAFDEVTNYRFLPLVAGYYKVDGSIEMAGNLGITAFSMIYKNGSIFKIGNVLAITAITADASINTITCLVSALIYLNGSTDYLELFGSYIGTTPAFVFGSVSTYFQAYLAKTA